MHTRPPRRSSSLAYRPDIDGLRAVAVLSVVGYHLRLGFFSGGFVGVDIFFVISGYLISAILLSELASGTFSLRTFYIRRIRRILPALTAVMLATSVLAYLFLLPAQLVDFAHTLLAVTFSVSNIYFAQHVSFFDPQSFEQPAIHTWSLGVEEQFYLLFPLLLWLLHTRLRRHLAAAVGLIAAVSFAISVAGAFRFPVVAYMMFYTRACELLLGTLLALRLLPRLHSALARNLLALAGVLMMTIAIHSYSLMMPFPGAAVLLPCMGAALLIWTGEPEHADGPHPELDAEQNDGHRQPARPAPAVHARTLIARLLTLRPMVFLGLISYSLYLWHWPIIAFQNLGALAGAGLPGRVLKLADFAAALALATLSWRFIEQPLRSGKDRLAGSQAFVFAATAVAILTLVAAAPLLLHGLPGRFPAAAVSVGAYGSERPSLGRPGCLVTRARNLEQGTCVREDATRQNWLLVGDQQAASLEQALAGILPATNLMQATLVNCLAEPGRLAGECGRLSQQLFTDFLPRHHVDRLVLAARWARGDLPAIDRIVTWAHTHGTAVTLIGPLQEYDAPLPQLLAYSIARHDPTLAGRHRSAGAAALDSTLEAAASSRWHIPYVSLYRMFCDAQGCATYTGAAGSSPPLLSNQTQFTREGAQVAVQRAAAAQLF
ncbi:MAG TPA: acyltransferase family protein [Acidobacteriaceae bacterium]